MQTGDATNQPESGGAMTKPEDAEDPKAPLDADGNPCVDVFGRWMSVPAILLHATPGCRHCGGTGDHNRKRAKAINLCICVRKALQRRYGPPPESPGPKTKPPMGEVARAKAARLQEQVDKLQAKVDEINAMDDEQSESLRKRIEELVLMQSEAAEDRGKNLRELEWLDAEIRKLTEATNRAKEQASAVHDVVSSLDQKIHANEQRIKEAEAELDQVREPRRRLLEARTKDLEKVQRRLALHMCRYSIDGDLNKQSS